MKDIKLYGEFEDQLAGLKDTCNFLPNVSTDEGYEKSKRVSLDAGKVLTNLEKSRKEKKAKSLEEGRAIDSEAKAIVAKIEEFQLPHKEAYKELDNLRKEREANRKAELKERVTVIRELPEAMADSDSEGVKMALESLQVEECLDFYEFTEVALLARNASKEALSKMFADKLKYEKEQKELVELRKKQAEQEQKDRDERIAKEAREAAEKQAAEAKEAEQRAIDQAALAVKQREEAETLAKRDAALAERNRIAAEDQANKDAEVAKIQAQKDAEAAAQKAELDLLNKQQVEADAEAERQIKIASNKRQIGKIRCEAKESIMALGIYEEQAKKLVLAIHNKEIANVTINYSGVSR